MATAKAVRTRTFWVGRFAPHPKCPKQTGNSYSSLKARPERAIVGVADLWNVFGLERDMEYPSPTQKHPSTKQCAIV
ncbi:MAG: hypothetical protein KME15_17810 [Drouetiella hepatica Uher 2000/2452]|uniref:Uncharacterized protein n=1 Tax=Drouetiella hepatica Uher 2000/2452 TaxID=904376 RepID=A0A951UNA3_9CYAN|nr:hypothetical protein [Drouetiella hepatica Uher 2000/2452]